jgi:hypothetical protein
MKFLILQLLAIFGLAGILLADDLTASSLTKTEQAEVRQNLEAYEKGAITLDELTTNHEDGLRLIGYYLLHTNDVTTKAKLPISRCFAGFGRYQEAAKLAADYVQIYSNDWRGWKIPGGAYVFTDNYEQALVAVTNSLRLGDEGSYVPVAMVALNLNRLDIVREIVPHLLELKHSKLTKEIKPLDVIVALVLYSLKADQPDIFIKALDGVEVKDVLSRDDLKSLVTGGCEKFKGKDIDKIRQKLGIAA